jgi:LPXTG-motif cell wall-anchored protein
VLPSTGSNNLAIVLVALATVIGGAALIRFTRRRPLP